VIVPEWGMIAPPRPVVGPKKELGVRSSPYWKYTNGKCSQHCCADS